MLFLAEWWGDMVPALVEPCMIGGPARTRGGGGGGGPAAAEEEEEGELLGRCM